MIICKILLDKETDQFTQIIFCNEILSYLTLLLAFLSSKPLFSLKYANFEAILRFVVSIWYIGVYKNNAYSQIKNLFNSGKKYLLFCKNGGTFYQKRRYILLKTYIRFIKNVYTFHPKRIYVFQKSNIPFKIYEYWVLFYPIIKKQNVKDILIFSYNT